MSNNTRYRSMTEAGFKGGAKQIRDSLSANDEGIILRGITTLTTPRYNIRDEWHGWVTFYHILLLDTRTDPIPETVGFADKRNDAEEPKRLDRKPEPRGTPDSTGSRILEEFFFNPTPFPRKFIHHWNNTIPLLSLSPWFVISWVVRFNQFC